MKNHYEIRDDVTAIFMRRKTGEIIETLISTSDLAKADELSGSWHVVWDHSTKTFYVKINRRKSNTGKWGAVLLHRWILGVTDPKFHVDHINHDTLNNTRSNLRLATASQNAQNLLKTPRNKHGGCLGVAWDERLKKWRVRIKVHNKSIHIGLFTNMEAAKVAAQKARAEHMPYSQEALLQRQAYS